MTEELDPIVARLQAMGTQPVDPSTQSDHLTRMAGATPARSAFRSALGARAKVGAGVLAGFLLGATGLTTAGALGPFQTVAANVVEAATPLGGLPKSDRTKAKADERADHDADGDGARLPDGSIGTQRIWDGCEPGEDGLFAGNRGQYLKQERAKGADELAAAKASQCGKPVAGDDDADGTEVESERGTKAESERENRGKSDAKKDKSAVAPSSSEANEDHGPKVEDDADDEQGEVKGDRGSVDEDHRDDAGRTNGQDDEQRSGAGAAKSGSGSSKSGSSKDA